MSNQNKDHNPPVKITPDEVAALIEGIRSESTGREYTVEESMEFARSRRQEHCS
ncbi:MAG TPA: hypothetical protein VGL56_05520 [Fimbriimonadaceae bacterium]|jgi:hypothetical protein